MTTYQHQHKGAFDWQELSVDLLNDVFEPLAFEDRIRLLYKYFDESNVLFTSSFGTKSVLLLHLVSQIRPRQKVHFLDTTFHFPETLAYKEELKELFNLRIVEVKPEPAPNALTREEQWWREHPRMCCSVNKVAPLEPIKARHKVWISGLMAYQTEFRSRLRVFERQGDILKFHPLIDMDEGEFLYYLSYYQLPRHPLEARGYGSIGCTHCTKKGAGRSGRWQGTNQSECGLHPGYFINKLSAKKEAAPSG
jgi:phosphoadenosine phosphosulfate reductase